MKIEAVTVCCDYGDFLAAVAPLNAPLFDRWIIVTKAEDAETRAVCAKFGLWAKGGKSVTRGHLPLPRHG